MNNWNNSGVPVVVIKTSNNAYKDVENLLKKNCSAGRNRIIANNNAIKYYYIFENIYIYINIYLFIYLFIYL